MSAVLSPCRRYRYWLEREVDLLGRGTLGFVLHNPSTADGLLDDPTVRRCIGFARGLGFARVVIVNLWAGRAADPRDLWAMEDPAGPENDDHIAAVAARCRDEGGYLIAGWSGIVAPQRWRALAAERRHAAEVLVAGAGCRLQALAINGDGSPKHPLYIPADAAPRPWASPSLNSRSAA